MNMFKDLEKLDDAYFAFTHQSNLIYLGPCGDFEDAVDEADRTVGDDNVVFYIGGQEALSWQSKLPKLLAQKHKSIGIDNSASLHGLGSPESMEQAHEAFDKIREDKNDGEGTDWWWVSSPGSQEEVQWFSVINNIIKPSPIENQIMSVTDDDTKDIIAQVIENRTEDKESNNELISILNDARLFSTKVNPNSTLMQAIAMFNVESQPHPENYVVSKAFQSVYNNAVSVSITTPESNLNPVVLDEFKSIVDATKKLTSEFHNNSDKLEF